VLWSNLNGDYANWSLIPHFRITLEGGFAWVLRPLIQDRFYTLLPFLFGIGFGIQLRRPKQRELSAAMRDTCGGEMLTSPLRPAGTWRTCKCQSGT